MRRRVGVAAAALAVSVGLVLSACDGGEDPTDPPTTETSSSASPTEPETDESTDSPTPPEVEAPTPAPEAATNDHVGAIYAAQYFIDLYGYVRQSGEAAQFEAMSAPECEFCASVVEKITAVYDDGGWVEGGDLEFDIDEATAAVPTADEPSYLVRFTVTEHPTVTHLGDGSTTEQAGGEARMVVALQFIDGRFIVFGVNTE